MNSLFEKYFIDNKNILLQKEIKKILNNKYETLDFFYYLYNKIFKISYLSFPEQLNLLEENYNFFNLDEKIYNFNTIKTFSYFFYNINDNYKNLNYYKKLIEQAKMIKEKYIQKALLYSCLIAMRDDEDLHLNVFFSQELIDLLFDDKLNIVENSEEYKIYQLLKDYFIFIFNIRR